MEWLWNPLHSLCYTFLLTVLHLTVHNVQRHWDHSGLTYQWKLRINLFSHNFRTKTKDCARSGSLMFASLAATSTNYDWINKTKNRIKNLKTGKQNSKRKKENLNRTKDNKKNPRRKQKAKNENKNWKQKQKNKTKQAKKKQAGPLNSKLTKLAIHSPRLYWLKLNGKKNRHISNLTLLHYDFFLPTHIHKMLIAATAIKLLWTSSGAQMNKRGSYNRRPWNYLSNPPLFSLLSPRF